MIGTLKVVSRTPSNKKISTTKQGGLSVNFNLHHIDLVYVVLKPFLAVTLVERQIGYNFQPCCTFWVPQMLPYVSVGVPLTIFMSV